MPEALFGAYSALFVAAFVAATIVPAQSELLLATLLAAGRFETTALLAAATAGNVLGSLVNWLIGRKLAHHADARWFPASERAMRRAEAWFTRFGPAALLLSWLPVVGDPLTLIAGVLRMRLIPFLVIVTIAKVGRYILLAAVVTGWSG